MKRTICISVAAMMIAAAAGFTANAGEPKYETMGFTRIIQDPVTMAMGGAGAVVGNAYSSYRNTAALPFWDGKFDVAASYQDWSPSVGSTNNFTVGAGWNISSKIAVSAGFTYGLCSKEDTYDNTGRVSGTFTPTEMQANVGFAWKFLPYLSIGANFKYLGNKLATDINNEAFSADIFLMTKLSDFRIALGVSSLGSDIESVSGASYSLPASVTLGAGYSHVFGEAHGLDILLDGDYYYTSGAFAVAVGAGYTWNDCLSVRAGYHYGSESTKDDGTVVSCVVPSYASVGIGGKFLGIRIDAAYLIAVDGSPMKNTFAVGLGYSF